jgi:hypothetical protein
MAGAMSDCALHGPSWRLRRRSVDRRACAFARGGPLFTWVCIRPGRHSLSRVRHRSGRRRRQHHFSVRFGKEDQVVLEGRGSGAQPLDLATAAKGNVVVSSEHPFGALDAVTTIREYDRTDVRFVRVLAPDRGIGFRKPRGLRFGRVAQDEVVVFDFVSGKCLGAVVRLPGLDGRAVIFFG